MLNRVEILKSDSCFTYAIKRIGIYEKFYNLESDEFLKLFDKHKIINPSFISKGSLIIYENNKDNSYEWNNRIITEDGHLISKFVSYAFHFMVYEKEFISDLTENNLGFNSIRYRTIDSFIFNDNFHYIMYEDLIKY